MLQRSIWISKCSSVPCSWSLEWNSVQMFEPFQDRNPHFFGTVSLSWLFMKSISKTYSLNLFLTKPLRKKFLGQKLDFWKSYFQFLRWNWVFWTNMGSNAAVTLQFEDLAVKNYLFLKYGFICWWKCQNKRAQTSEHCSKWLHLKILIKFGAFVCQLHIYVSCHVIRTKSHI